MKQKFKWHRFISHVEHSLSLPETFSIKIAWKEAALSLVGGEGDDRGWDGWMASLTQRTGVWVDSGSWWWTGRPTVLQSMGLQRVGHDWATELNRISLRSLPWPGLEPPVSLAEEEQSPDHRTTREFLKQSPLKSPGFNRKLLFKLFTTWLERDSIVRWTLDTWWVSKGRRRRKYLEA